MIRAPGRGDHSRLQFGHRYPCRSVRMSVRATGNPGLGRVASRVALVLGLLASVAGPLAPLTAAAGGVTVTTPFPAVVAEPGSTASFKLAIDTTSARQVNLKADGLPSGWTARFRGGGLTIDGAYVTPSATPPTGSGKGVAFMQATIVAYCSLSTVVANPARSATRGRRRAGSGRGWPPRRA